MELAAAALCFIRPGFFGSVGTAAPPSSFVSTDGIAARGIVDDEHSPVRNFVQGVIDD